MKYKTLLLITLLAVAIYWVTTSMMSAQKHFATLATEHSEILRELGGK